MAKFSPKHVKPSVKGMAHMGHLGHFAQDRFIQQGHNDDGKVDIKARDIRDAISMSITDPVEAAKTLATINREDDLESDAKKMKSRNGDSN